MNPKKFTLAEVTKAIPALCHLFRTHKVRLAYILGSVLHNSSSPLSDLDIAVLPPPNLQDWLTYYNRLHGDLCQIFRADNIDLLLLDKAPLSLQARVVLEGQRIFQEDNAEDWEERILARHADLAGWHKENWEITKHLARQGATKEINMLEREKVERFVFLIRDAVHELQALDLERVGLEELLADKKTRALAEHYLRIAIEATLDLGRHIIVRTGLGVPQEYREVGKILGEQRVVPPNLAKKLQAMAGMRNVLVHLYWDIDYELLYRTIVEELDTFERCIEYVFSYLEKLEE